MTQQHRAPGVQRARVAATSGLQIVPEQRGACSRGLQRGATAALQLTTCLGGHGEVEQREDGGAPGPHRAEVQQHGGQPVSVVGPGTSLALRPGSGQASALNTSYNLSVDRVEVVHVWLIVTPDTIRDDLCTRN